MQEIVVIRIGGRCTHDVSARTWAPRAGRLRVCASKRGVVVVVVVVVVVEVVVVVVVTIIIIIVVV